jgi:hypothetical protein
MSGCPFNNKGRPDNSDNNFSLKLQIPQLFKRNRSRSLWYIHCQIPNEERIAPMSTAAVDLVKLTVRRAEFVKTGMVRSKLNSGVLKTFKKEK